MGDRGSRIPQAWVGWDLILCGTGTESRELVTLRDVGEFGLAFVYEAGEVEGWPVFVPWSRVSWMRPPLPGDLGAPETETG